MSELSEALADYKARHGHFARRELLERVAGVSTQSDIPAAKESAVIAACNKGGRDAADRRAKASRPDFNDPSFVAGVYSRWNGAGSAS